MKATKKVISFLLIMALVFSMSASIESAAKKKAPKLNKKKVTLKVGKTVKLKVKNTKKKVKWSIKSGKKNIKLTKKKKTSVIVTAKKKGKATVIAKLGKKTLKCNITIEKKEGKKKDDTATVVPAVKLNAVKVLNPETIQVELSSVQKLSATNFAIYNKTYKHGSYNRKLTIAGVTSTDQKNYIIKVDNVNSEIQENEYIQVTVTGLQKTGTASLETVYVATPEIYESEEIFPYMAGEEMKNSISFLGDGSGEIVSQKVPKGIKCEISQDGEEILLEGTISTIGIHTGEIIFKDELNNTFVKKLTWLVGDEQNVYAMCSKNYHTYNRKAPEDTSTIAFVAGGSGEFRVTAEDEDFDGYINYSSYLRRTFINTVVPKAGITNYNFKVVDKKNSKVKTTFVWTIEAKETKTVPVTIKDAVGNEIEKIYSIGHFRNQAKSSPYNILSNISLEDDGKYYVSLLPGDTYDITLEYHSCKKIYDFKMTDKIEKLEFVLPIYPITLQMKDLDISNVEWYGDVAGDYVAKGKRFYCEPGKYELSGELLGDTVYDLKVSFTYDGKNSVTAKPTIVSQRAFAKGTVTTATGTAIVLAKDYEYYKFIPEESGEYAFYCVTEDAYSGVSEDTVGKLYDENMEEIAYNDDVYGEETTSTDFRFTQTCEAGKTYYLGVKGYEDEEHQFYGLNAVLHVEKQ